MNRFLEHQDLFNRSKLVPGEVSYTSAVKSTWLNLGKQNRIIIFSDSIFCGIRFRKFNNEIKNGYAKLKTFPGADSREILHYVSPTLESGNYDSAVLHFGVNDLLQKKVRKTDIVKNLIENIRKAAVKCMSHGVSKVFESAIVRNKRIPESLLEEVNENNNKNDIVTLLYVRIIVSFLLIIAIFIIFIYFTTACTWWNRVDVF